MGGEKIDLHSDNFSLLQISQRGELINAAILRLKTSEEILSFFGKYSHHLLTTTYGQYPDRGYRAISRANQDIAFVLVSKRFSRIHQNEWAEILSTDFRSFLTETKQYFSDLRKAS